jgi:hypothetical protein
LRVLSARASPPPLSALLALPQYPQCQLDIASPHPALPILPILNGCAAPDKYLVLLLVYLRMCCGKVAGNKGKDEEGEGMV